MSIFSKIALRPPKRSPFDLSFQTKLTTKFGALTPVLVQETIPGDVFRHSHELFLQFMPLNSQLMQSFDVDVHYFHVPTRLIYDDFEKFLVGGDDGTQTFVPPFFTPAAYGAIAYNIGFSSTDGLLSDYLGLPDLMNMGGQTPNLHLSALPFRAYQKVYDDFFRDENLCPEQLIATTGGQVSNTELTSYLNLLYRAWRKDYFTSALPWTQKGVEVTLPLGEKAPVHFTTSATTSTGSSYTPSFAGNGTDDPSYDGLDDGNNMLPPGEAYADLQNATAATIDQLRTAEMVQEWLEKNARGGTRYNEQIYSHFGVRTPDSRLDRAEFIGWSSSPVTCGNVFSTNSSDGNNVQAFPVANANSGNQSPRWKYKVKEHGYLIGLLSVKPRAGYFQGVPKSFLRNDKFDYYWPEFAHLGEQAIMDYELYFPGSSNQVFGYTPRYADLKVRQDEVHGDFRGNLKFYHDAREFAAMPSLSQQFVEVRPANDNLLRIFNNISANNDKLLINMRHNLKAIRPMPYFGTPQFK